ncbi:MAG: hypothetical protein RIR36_983, partial [Bacteroidota bacterium]
MKKKIHVIVAIIGMALQLLSNQIIAQNASTTAGNDLVTVTGKVISINDNQPLANVTVKVLKSKTGT